MSRFGTNTYKFCFEVVLGKPDTSLSISSWDVATALDTSNTENVTLPIKNCNLW